jgi:hypothetical protein
MKYPYLPKVKKLANGVYAITGTMYGYLHTTGGDIRTWRSYSGAYKAAIRYRDMYENYFEGSTV